MIILLFFVLYLPNCVYLETYFFDIWLQFSYICVHSMQTHFFSFILIWWVDYEWWNKFNLKFQFGKGTKCVLFINTYSSTKIYSILLIFKMISAYNFTVSYLHLYILIPLWMCRRNFIICVMIWKIYFVYTPYTLTYNDLC